MDNLILSKNFILSISCVFLEITAWLIIIIL